MRPEFRHARLPNWPLAYQSRRRPVPRIWRGGVGVRMAGTAAAALTFGCLLVAVPCFVFAAVGVWFDDASASSAAVTAVAAGGGGAAAAVTAWVCHRRQERVRLPLRTPDFWN